MSIEVENHLWVAITAAAFDRQFGDECRRGGGDASVAYENAARYMEEAESVADRALGVYRKIHGLEPLEGSSPS